MTKISILDPRRLTEAEIDNIRTCFGSLEYFSQNYEFIKKSFEENFPDDWHDVTADMVFQQVYSAEELESVGLSVAADVVVVASAAAAFCTPNIKRVGSDPINDDPKRKCARFEAISTPMPFQPAVVVEEEVDGDALRARITYLETEKEKDILALRARITALEAEKEKDILALRARITALEAEKEIHFNGYLRRINLLKVEIARLKKCKTCPQCTSSKDDQDDVVDNLSPEERFPYLFPEKHLEMYWGKKEKLSENAVSQPC